jgi:hypothetical protein
MRGKSSFLRGPGTAGEYPEGLPMIGIRERNEGFILLPGMIPPGVAFFMFFVITLPSNAVPGTGNISAPSSWCQGTGAGGTFRLPFIPRKGKKDPYFTA